jgi:hypothetical protein
MYIEIGGLVILNKINLLVIVMVVILLNGCTNNSDDLKSSDVNADSTVTNNKDTYNDSDNLNFVGSKFDMKNLLIKNFSKEVEFKQDIKKEIVDKIKDTDLTDYNLVITNKEYYQISIFNDLIAFVNIIKLDEDSIVFD